MTRKLEVQYLMNKISVNYEKEAVLWTNAALAFNKDSSIHLKLWEDGIEPEQISATWEGLKDRAEALWVALKYRGDHSIRLLSFGFSIYYHDDKEFILQNETDIADTIYFLRDGRGQYKEPFPPLLLCCDIVQPVATSSISLPNTMPFIPTDLHIMAETLIAAEGLSRYPDLVMKLSYLVLEDFECYLSKDEIEGFAFVRDFVSHSICYRKEKLVHYIGERLPSSKTVSDKGKTAVRFERNDKDHMAFVAKHAHLALKRAKELFEERVQGEGGFVRD